MLLNIQQWLQDGIVRQHMTAFAVTLSMAVVGLGIGWISPALPKLLSGESPLHEPISHVDVSWIGSLPFFCMILSSVPAGRIMDRFGRKRTLLALSVLPISSWLCVLVSSNIYLLYSARVLTGLWGGVGHTVVPVYIGEIAEPKIRSTVTSYTSVMNNVGALIPFVVGPYVSYNTLALCCLALTIISIATLFSIPETPYYYLMRNDRECALEALNRLRGKQADLSSELDAIKCSVEAQMKNKIRFTEIVQTKGNRRALLIIETIFILQRFNGIGPLKTYGSIILPTLYYLNANECLIVISLAWIMAGAAAIYITNRVRRKVLLMVTSFIGALTMVAAGSWFYLSTETEIDVEFCNYAPFTLFFIQGFQNNIGITPIAHGLKGELFPANIRGYASSISTITMAASGFVSNLIFLPIADTAGMYVNCLMYAASCLLVMLFVPLCLIETKGKSLQEIQDKLNHV